MGNKLMNVKLLCVLQTMLYYLLFALCVVLLCHYNLILWRRKWSIMIYLCKVVRCKLCVNTHSDHNGPFLVGERGGRERLWLFRYPFSTKKSGFMCLENPLFKIIIIIEDATKICKGIQLQSVGIPTKLTRNLKYLPFSTRISEFIEDSVDGISRPRHLSLNSISLLIQSPEHMD